MRAMGNGTPEKRQAPLSGPPEPKLSRISFLQNADPSIDYQGLLHQIFEETARRHGERIAIECRDRKISYRELEARANRFARFLRKSGVKQGDRVCLLLAKSIDLYVAVLGTLKAGATYVPLDPFYPEERIQFIAADSGAVLPISSLEFLGTAGKIGVPKLFVNEAREQIGKQSPTPLPLDMCPQEEAYVICTSGSTGTPKGVAVSHAFHLVQALQCMESSLDMLQTLYATLYLNPWYRALGVKVGKRAEISTASFILPDLLHIGQGSFIADGVELGPAKAAGGEILLRKTHIGSKTFIGNSAFIPVGARIGNNCLIGVQTSHPGRHLMGRVARGISAPAPEAGEAVSRGEDLPSHPDALLPEAIHRVFPRDSASHGLRRIHLPDAVILHPDRRCPRALDHFGFLSPPLTSFSA